MNKSVVSTVLAAAIVLTFALSGCKGDQAEQAPPPAPAPAARPLAAKIALRYSPDPPAALKDTALTVSVTGGDGGPLPGAQVVLDLSMPGMYHGENRPKMTETSPGVYEGTGILTMGGQWLARVEVSHGGSLATRDFYFDAVDK